MSESTPQPILPVQNPERYKTLVVILTVLTTVLTSIVAGLQADANIRASRFNRDSQLFAILASGELQRQSLQVAYDTGVLSGILQDSQEANVLMFTSLQQSQAGEPEAAASSELQSAVSQARADAAMKFSIFFTDPRYTPSSADEPPDMESYIADSFAAANELVAKQNAASDGYNLWNRKSDSYTSVLTILAVALFLFGLAQALAPRQRLVFSIFGMVVVAAAGFWTLLNLVS